MPTDGRSSGKPCRCILVSQMFPPAVGGSGVLLDNVYSRMQGHEVIALVDSATVGSDSPAHPSLDVRGVRIDADAWSLFDPTAWPHQLRLARRIHALASRHQGVVHCGRAQPEGVAAFLASRVRGGPPYVFWAHGEDITVGGSSRQFRATMSVIQRYASCALANSRNTADLLRSAGGYTGRVVVVYPGVDARRFHPAADDGSVRRRLAPHGELVLLSVARLQPRKGHDLVLQAVRGLRRSVPAVRYVIVGTGGELEPLQRLTRELDLQDLVQFVGEVRDGELPAYFAAADVFVLPTRVEAYDFEGFGIVYLEAAAAGKPTIGGRNGGVPEAIVEGETGLLVSGASAAELEEALKALCDSEPLRRRLGSAGRERALRDFTWEAAAATVTQVHEEVARDTSPRPASSA